MIQETRANSEYVFRAELINHVYRQTPHVVMISLISSVAIAVVVSTIVPMSYSATWFGITTLLLMIRLVAWRQWKLSSGEARTPVAWKNIYLPLVFLSGTTWGIGATLLLPFTTGTLQSFVLITIAAAGVASIPYLGAVISLFSAFFLSHMIPPLLWLLAQEDRVWTLAWLLCVVFMLSTFLSALSFNAQLRSTIKQRIDNGSLKRRLQSINKSLESKIEYTTDHLNLEIETRKLAQKGLEDARRRQRLIINQNPVFTIVMDSDGSVRFLNTYSEKRLGYRGTDYIGKRIFDFTKKHEHFKIREKIREALEFGSTAAELFFKVRRNDGEWIDLEAEIVKLDDANNVQLMLSARDVTDRLILERSKSHAEQKLKDFADAAGEFLWECDDKLRICFLSDRASIVLDQIPDYVSDIGLPMDERDMAILLDDPQMFRNLELTVNGSKGNNQYVSISGKPVFDADGSFQGYRGTGIDITISRNASESETRVRAEKAANQAKSNFLANISHEFRTPLTVIQGITDYLSDQNLDDELKGNIDSLIKATDVLTTLVGDTLDYTSIESGQTQFEKHEFDLLKLIDDVQTLMKSRLPESGSVGLRIEVDDGLQKQRIGDYVHLRQVLLVLVENALKFTRKGEVSVRIEEGYRENPTNPRSVRFSVSDTGIGIDPKHKQQIFNRFSQADDSITREFGGAGLGLAICRALVEQMEGYITVKSSLGTGSTFYFEVPLPVAGEIVDSVAPKSMEPNTNEMPCADRICAQNKVLSGKELSILVVEDRLELQRIISLYLKSTPHKPTFANNGLEGFDTFICGNYDLVLMDIQMPVMDGYTATRKIRDWEFNNHMARTPICALTASVAADDVRQIFDAGCDFHLSKPIRKAKLLDWLDNFRDRLEENQAASILQHPIET